MAANTDLFRKTTNNFSTTLTGSIGAGDSTISLASTTNLPTDTGIDLVIDRVNASGTATPTVREYVKGVVSGGNVINLLRGQGNSTAQAHASGAVVEQVWTGTTASDVMTGVLTQHTQTGTHAAITGPSAVFTGNVTAANFIQSGGAAANGWTVGLATPNTITALGNRSYSLVFNGTDLTGTVSNGMRLLMTRTVAAPTQCTSLNGSTQYYSKTSPAGMTFTNNFVVNAWIKISAYQASGGIIASRYNGTSGWQMSLNSSGQLSLVGYNGGSNNSRSVSTYQSIPLNKWVHVYAALDMSGFTTATCKAMIEGVDVPVALTSGGTNPTSLVQAGNLEIGSWNGGLLPFGGKIAQAAIWSAIVSEATMLTYISQGLAGTETSLISAYSFNNSINDLNANANNLTANGSAVATNADSPYAQGATAGTLEYGIITANSFSTNTTLTVQVPEGSTIPTTGGVSAVSYSTQEIPYGFPANRNKWQISLLNLASLQFSSPGVTTRNPGGLNINLPIGSWTLVGSGGIQSNWGSAGASDNQVSLGTSSTVHDTTDQYLGVYTDSATTFVSIFTFIPRHLDLTTATPYYLLLSTTRASANYISFVSPTIISATLNYV